MGVGQGREAEVRRRVWGVPTVPAAGTVGTAGTGGAGAEANINMAEATEPLALAAPTAAMSARLTAKKYLPTALISKQLPARLSDMRTVPRLKAPDEWNDEAARLAEYVAAIRATASVFQTYNHKTETLAAYDSYMVWIDMWLRLSGFGSFVDVDLQVSRHQRVACACVRACKGRVVACDGEHGGGEAGGGRAAARAR